jgi:hypothetical protein
LAAAVAVEEILARVDIERRPSFGMQRTEPDKLGVATGRPGNPVMLSQIIKERQVLFEFVDVLAHSAVLPQELSLGEDRRHS